MATRRRGRKKSSTASSKKTRKIGGKIYTKKGCSTTKTGAKALAKRLKARHKSVRRIGKCVYTRG